MEKHAKRPLLHRIAVLGAAVALSLGTVALFSGCASANAAASPQAAQSEGALAAALDTYYQGCQEEGLLISAHAQFGIGCADCHDQSKLETWAGSEKDAEGFVVDEDYKFGRYSCLSCHDDGNPLTGKDLEEIKASAILTGTVTSYNKEGLYNVHSNHRSEQDCSDCHSMHGQSVVSCTYCHELDSIPEGWTITFDYCG